LFPDVQPVSADGLPVTMAADVTELPAKKRARNDPVNFNELTPRNFVALGTWNLTGVAPFLNQSRPRSTNFASRETAEHRAYVDATECQLNDFSKCVNETFLK
jgi:hypothetical protein